VWIFAAEIRRHHESEDHVGWAVITGSAGSAVALDPLSAEHEHWEQILVARVGSPRACRIGDTARSGSRQIR
jgi:hypothetical protein